MFEVLAGCDMGIQAGLLIVLFSEVETGAGPLRARQNVGQWWSCSGTQKRMESAAKGLHAPRRITL